MHIRTNNGGKLHYAFHVLFPKRRVIGGLMRRRKRFVSAIAKKGSDAVQRAYTGQM